MTPIQYKFWEFLKIRELARMHKEAGVFPHTNDPVVANYSFCNINREHDAVTRWIKANVRDHDVINSWGVNAMVLNIAVARIFNTPGTLSEIMPMSTRDLISGRTLKTVQERQARKLTIFRGAYMMPSHGSPEELLTPPAEYYLKSCVLLSQMDFRPARSLQDAADLLIKVPGFGPFLVNQIVTDLRYTQWFELAEDWQTFVMGGPGTSRGLCRYFAEPKIIIGKSQLWIKARLFAVREEAKQYANGTINGYFLDPNNLSNSFCEFDKYVRASEGGRLKKHYRPINPTK